MPDLNTLPGVLRLRALTQQPLQPVGPQRALDIGLFEAIRPEAPGETMPDE